MNHPPECKRQGVDIIDIYENTRRPLRSYADAVETIVVAKWRCRCCGLVALAQMIQIVPISR